MASIDDIYKSKSNFLKAADLGGGKPVVEIETAEVQENTYNGETKQQIVLTFVDKEKVLGLNVTNARRIAQLTGTTDFHDWPGYRIRLFTDQTDMDGKTVDCIRIFPDLPEQGEAKAMAAAATRQNDPNDDIPF
jgi:hypothetical protein